MTTMLKASGKTLNLENVTHAQVNSGAVVLFPANYFQVRAAGEEAAKAVEMMKANGFVGDGNTLVNPNRVVLAEEAGQIARLLLDGAAKMVIVPVGFLENLRQEVSGAGNVEAKPRRKKGAE